jgi:hypothetical protein
MAIEAADGILMLAAVLAAAGVLYYALKQKRAPARPAVRSFTGPFAPHLQASITHENGSPLEDGDYVAVIVIGTDGFTARFRVSQAGPAGIQFLAPERALIRFRAGTEFRVAQGKDVVGKGKVLVP